MKFGKGLRKGTMERLQMALGQDPSIVVPRSTLGTTAGVTEEYLVSIGLTPGDLKRLEACGFAIRGYKHAMNNGVRNGGYRKRWLLVGDDTGAV